MLSRSRALGLLAAGAAAARARPARAQAATLRMGAVGTVSFAEPYFLLETPFLKNAGLGAEIITFNNGGQIGQALAGGSVDIGLSDMIQVANAVAHELPFAFFAGSSTYRSESPLTLMCVARNSPLRTAKDLEGQIIGVNGLRTMAELSAREWLRANGADPAKLRFIEISPALAVPALLRGTVAAAMVSEPLIASAGDEVRHFAKPYDQVARQFYISSFFAKREWLAQNSATARKLTQAIYETARWANSHFEESVPILAKYLKLEPERIRAMARSSYATSLDPKLMQPQLDIAAKYGVLEKPIDAQSLIVRVD
jgi:NitT/TauT family transport system substrate-binding protein